MPLDAGQLLRGAASLQSRKDQRADLVGGMLRGRTASTICIRDVCIQLAHHRC